MILLLRRHGASFRSIDTVLVDALLYWQLLVCRAQIRAVHLFEPSADQHGRVAVPLTICFFRRVASAQYLALVLSVLELRL